LKILSFGKECSGVKQRVAKQQMAVKRIAKQIVKNVVTKVAKAAPKQPVVKTGGIKETKPRVSKEVMLSPQLSQLVNATTLSRPQALKALWVYIK
jgi:chromatin remodeling complex protein RSC6